MSTPGPADGPSVAGSRRVQAPPGGPQDGGLADPGDVRLRPPAHRVDPRAKSWWTVRSALGGLLVLVPQLVGAGALATVGLSPVALVVTATVTVVLGVAHLVVVPRWRYSIHRWEATDEAVHTLSGWLRLEWRIAPISRIQTVDTDQGPMQRVFGLSSVTVTTASASGALRIEGLDTPEAGRLARRLTAATQAVGGDAT